MKELYFKAGSIIFQRGDPAASFYTLAEGAVEVFDPETGYRVGVIEAGGTFGEQAVLEYGLRSLSARAVEDSHCMEHSGRALRDLMSKETGTLRHGLEMALLQLEMLNHLHAQGSDIKA
ncbi:MAG: hypothetical protein RL247_833 [Actinomycetota bacterium]|jgi:CRP-like cAMP-binding protein